MQTISWTFTDNGILRHYPTSARIPRLIVLAFVALAVLGAERSGYLLAALPTAVFYGVAAFLGVAFVYVIAADLKNHLSRHLQFMMSDSGISVSGGPLLISHPYSALEDFRISRKTDPPKLIIRIKDPRTVRGMPPWYEVPLVGQDPERIRSSLSEFLPESTTTPPL